MANEYDKIKEICMFNHCIIYWLPNSEKFIIENPNRSDSKYTVLTADSSIFDEESIDIDMINAIFGMHIDKDSDEILSILRQNLRNDSENTRIINFCEIGYRSDDQDTDKYRYVIY